MKPISVPVQKGGGYLDIRGVFGLEKGRPYTKVMVVHNEAGWYITEPSFSFIRRNAEHGKVHPSGPHSVRTDISETGISMTVLPMSGQEYRLDEGTVMEVARRMNTVVSLMDWYDLEGIRESLDAASTLDPDEVELADGEPAVTAR